jgi:predicted nucleic acid-binding protein
VTRLVVDASVAVKWFVPEVHGAAAGRWLGPSNEFVAPDLIWPEFGNVMWKKARRGEITFDTARRLLADFQRFPINTVPSAPFIDTALAVAETLGRTVYDSLYLAVAMAIGGPLVTADRRLRDAVVAGSLGRHVLWVEDRPA